MRQRSIKLQSKNKQIKAKYIAPTKSISKANIRSLLKNRHENRSSSKNLELKSIKVKVLYELIDQGKCQCPICIQIAVQPILLKCGHIYCLKCFQQTSVISLVCCMCRAQVNSQDVKFSLFMEQFIDNWVRKKQINYWCRKGEDMDWEKVRKINIKNLKIGDIIDFRKENCNWRKGVISNFNYESGQCHIQIRIFQIRGYQYILIPLKSRNLAPCGFFTNGIYLSHRTIDYESKFIQSIQIPQIQCQLRRDQNDLQINENIKKPMISEIYDENDKNDEILELFEYQMKQRDNIFGID